MPSVDLRLGVNTRAVTSGLDALRRDIGKFREQASKDMQGGLIRSMHYLNGAIGLVKGGLSGIGGLFESVFKPSANMETLQAQFGALLKSQEEAAALIERLRKLNVESPLQLEDFAAGAKALLGVGMGADMATDALAKMSNISMGSSENFDSLVRAFSQVNSAGRLMGQEVLQFVNAGFNPLKQISLQTGESMADLKKRMEDGAISFQEVANAITFATAKGGLFNDMNAKVSATFTGRLAKLADAWTQLKVAIGTPIMEAIKPLVDAITKKIESMKDAASRTGNVIGDWVTFFREAIIAGNGFDALWLGIQKGALETAKVIKDAIKNSIKGSISESIDAVSKEADRHIAIKAVTGIARVQRSIQEFVWNSAVGTDHNLEKVEDIRNPISPTKKGTIEDWLDKVNADIESLKTKIEPAPTGSTGAVIVGAGMEAMAAYKAQTDRMDASFAASQKSKIDAEWQAATDRVAAARAQAEQIMGRREDTIADSLQRIGGGGVAFTRMIDPIEETAKNTAKTNVLIDKLLNKPVEANWAP